MKEALDVLRQHKDVALAYFRVVIDRLDYYDLTPTPPILRHYDRSAGTYSDLNPFGQKQ